MRSVILAVVFAISAPAWAQSITPQGVTRKDFPGLVRVVSADPVGVACGTSTPEVVRLFPSGSGYVTYLCIASAWAVASSASALDLEGSTLTGILDLEFLIGTGAGTANYAALSGDATVSNSGVVTVVDDLHAHTSSSVSGLDISADTNLTASNGIQLVGDAISAATTSGTFLSGDSGGSLACGSGARGQAHVRADGKIGYCDDNAILPVYHSGQLTTVDFTGSVDISSQTNLTATSPVVLTGDDLSIASNSIDATHLDETDDYDMSGIVDFSTGQLVSYQSTMNQLGSITVHGSEDLRVRGAGGNKTVKLRHPISRIVIDPVASTRVYLGQMHSAGGPWEVICFADTGTVEVDVQECQSIGTFCNDIQTAKLTCDSDRERTTSFSDTVLGDNRMLKIWIGAITGTPTELYVELQVYHTF